MRSKDSNYANYANVVKIGQFMKSYGRDCCNISGATVRFNN